MEEINKSLSAEEILNKVLLRHKIVRYKDVFKDVMKDYHNEMRKEEIKGIIEEVSKFQIRYEKSGGRMTTDEIYVMEEIIEILKKKL